jgi:hypothetical protein
VQRLFSMFPPGGPGIGLLLLRISVAGALVVTGVNRSGVSSFFWVAALLIALSLTAGFLTQYLSLIACVSGIVIFVARTLHLDLILALLILNASALALVGPGAYSIDARLFGRRVVVVPRQKSVDSK